MENNSTFIAHKPHRTCPSNRIFFTNTPRERGAEQPTFLSFLQSITNQVQTETFFRFDGLDFPEVQAKLNAMLVTHNLQPALDSINSTLQTALELRKSLMRIVITKPTEALRPRKQVNALLANDHHYYELEVNRNHNIDYYHHVELINFRGEIVDWARFDSLERFDPDAINLLRKKGAIVRYPNLPEINEWIELAIKRNPEFKGCIIQNNNICQ